jgi:hypothetical protein
MFIFSGIYFIIKKRLSMKRKKKMFNSQGLIIIHNKRTIDRCVYEKNHQ